MKNMNLNGRTDVAVEEVALENNSNIDFESFEYGAVEVSKVTIPNDSNLNKKPGLYFNIDLKEEESRENSMLLEEVTIKYLNDILNVNNIKEDSSVLVVGLGNSAITPDALGPKVAKSIFVTNHIFEMDSANIEDGFRRVSSIRPGVMGDTGIETFDIIKSVVDKVKPDIIIVVDALASVSIERLNKSIQISDSGISPGSGVGNKRKEISKESMGVPTIAIGVPTVVDAASITVSAMERVMKFLSEELKGETNPLAVLATKKTDFDKIEEPSKEVKKELLGQIGKLNPDEIKQLVFETLTPNGLNLIVTPKEIDESIINLSKIIAESINKTLHTSLQ